MTDKEIAVGGVLTSSTVTNATVWLVVKRSYHGEQWLFWRKLRLDHSPRPVDEMMILSSEEEPEGCVLHTVKSLYWDLEGRLNITMKPFVLDTELSEGAWKHETSWWTDVDGDLVARLRESGWTDDDYS